MHVCMYVGMYVCMVCMYVVCVMYVCNVCMYVRMYVIKYVRHACVCMYVWYVWYVCNVSM